jgi:hypothetical protein
LRCNVLHREVSTPLTATTAPTCSNLYCADMSCTNTSPVGVQIVFRITRLRSDSLAGEAPPALVAPAAVPTCSWLRVPVCCTGSTCEGICHRSYPVPVRRASTASTASTAPLADTPLHMRRTRLSALSRTTSATEGVRMVLGIIQLYNSTPAREASTPLTTSTSPPASSTSLRERHVGVATLACAGSGHERVSWLRSTAVWAVEAASTSTASATLWRETGAAARLCTTRGREGIGVVPRSFRLPMLVRITAAAAWAASAASSVFHRRVSFLRALSCANIQVRCHRRRGRAAGKTCT